MSPLANTPWLSIIMPTFNGEKHLKRALDSIVEQDEKSLELIVIDDGSTDATLELLEQYVHSIPYTLLQSVGGKSWIRSTNRGLAQAKGEYVCFLHQDDYWLPSRLATLRKLAARHADAVLLLHPSNFVDDDGRHLGTWNCPFPKNEQLLSSSFLLRRLLVQNFIAIHAPIFRRDAAIAAGALDESLWFTADWKFWTLLACNGNWVYHPEVLGSFRIHPHSQTIQGANSVSLRGQYEPILDEFLPKLPPSDATHALAKFSSECNVALSEFFLHRRWPPLRLLFSATKLGPVGWYKYLRYSRILERVLPRLHLYRTAV